MADRRYPRAMVEAQLRDVHVPIPTPARHETERVQEAILHPATEEQYVPSDVPLPMGTR